MKILILTYGLSNMIGGMERFNEILIDNFSKEHVFFEIGSYLYLSNFLNNENTMYKNQLENSSSCKYVFNCKNGRLSKFLEFYKTSNDFYKNSEVEKKHNIYRNKLTFLQIIKNVIWFFIPKALYYYFKKNLQKIKNKKRNTNIIINFINRNKIDLIISPVDINNNFEINISKIKKIKKIGIVHSNIDHFNRQKKIKIDRDKNIFKYVNRHFCFFIKKFKIKGFDKILISNLYEFDILNKVRYMKKRIYLICFPTLKKEEILNNKSFINRNEIIYVGRLSQVDKNLIELNQIAKMIPQYKINVYGEGNDKSYLNEKNIILHGKKNNQELFNIYKKSKILLLTSSTEGIPFVISEALSFGLIVICYDTFYSCHWTLANGRGILVKPFDTSFFSKCIVEVMEYSKDIFSNQSFKNIDFAAKNFSIEHYIYEWKKIFNCLF